MEPRAEARPVATTRTSAPPARPVADLVAEDVVEAVRDLDDGRSTRARRRLSSLWAQVPVGSPHRPALAHWLAAAEQDLPARLAWRERALQAAEEARDWSVPFAGTALTLGDVYPELHLELADGYRAAGSSCGALEHLALARNAVDAAVRGERRDRLRRQLAALERRIAGTPDGCAEQDWGWEREDEQDLVGFWDDEGSDW